MQTLWVIGLIVLIVVADYIAYRHVHKKKKNIIILNDNVNHPNHYNQNNIETIDIIRQILGPDQFAGFLMGNIIKYLDRHEFKNGREDLHKAHWYADKLTKEFCLWKTDDHSFVDNLIEGDFDFAIENYNDYRKKVEKNLSGE